MTISRQRKWLSSTLIAFGLVCLAFYATVTIRAAAYQRRARAEVERMITARDSATAPRASAPRALATGELVGRVEIPRLKLSAVVAEGDDDATLGKAVGHLPDTPLPWHRRGNVGLAAHRDGLFRALEHIRSGDEIRIVTARGDYTYHVTGTQIVLPRDVSVLAPTPRPSVTLITCYPFSFVGHAPKRFIVRAELVGGVEGTVLKGSTVR